MRDNDEAMSDVTVVAVDLARADHGAAVLELLSLYARDEMGGGAALPPQTRERLLPALRERSDYFGALAWAGGEAVGLINGFEGFSTFKAQPLLNIHDVFVAPRWRGRGVARRLLAWAEAVARSRGCCKLTLEVLEGNEAAQAVYRRQGFRPYTLDARHGRAMFWEKPITGAVSHHPDPELK